MYVLERQLVFEALSFVEEFGAFGATSAISALPRNASVGELGQELLNTLEMSGVRNAWESPDSDQDALFRLAGVRSHRELVQSASYLHVSKVGSEVAVSLWPRARKGGGWIAPPEDTACSLVSPTPAELGLAIVRVANLS